MVNYTGNKNQPDTMIVSVKSEDGKRSIKRINLPPANWWGFIPVVSSYVGIVRIINAAKVIFKEMSQMELRKNDPHLYECWNGFKNLFRGLIEMVPVIGNVSLIIFDSLRGAIHFGKVLRSIKGQKGIGGIAVDGKVVFQLDLESIEKLKLKSVDNIESDQQCLDALDMYSRETLESIERRTREKNEKVDLCDALKITSRILVQFINK